MTKEVYSSNSEQFVIYKALELFVFASNPV